MAPPSEELERPTSITSEEEQIVPKVDERHGLIKSPTAEEQDEISRQKQDALAVLAQQLEGQIEQDLVLVENEVPDIAEGTAAALAAATAAAS